MTQHSSDPRWQQTPTGWLFWNGKAWVPATPVDASRVRRGLSGKQKVAATVAVAVVATVTILNATRWGARPEVDQHSTPAYGQAACEVAVEAQLKAGKADHFADEIVGASPGGFTVMGTVYATNSFNAVVPTPFTCAYTSATLATTVQFG